MDKHVHTILVFFLYAGAAMILGALVSLGWNMAAGSGYRYLTDEQVGKLENFLFSGTIGSALTFAAKRIVKGRDG